MNALSGKIVHTYEEFNSRLTALIEELLKTINIKSLEIKSPGNESHLAWSLILIVFKSSSIKAVSLELNSPMLFFSLILFLFLQDDHYLGPSVDIWALGILLYLMVTGGMPFKGTTVAELKNAILDGHFEMPDYLSQSCIDLIVGILKRRPDWRLTLQQVRNSFPFFVLFLFTKFIYVVVDIWSWKELNWTLICLIKLNEIEKVSQSLWVRGCAIWYLTHENPSPLNNWNQNSNQDWRGLKRFPSFTFK